MPYEKISDLPEAQVDQYTTHQKHAFLKAFNNAYGEYGGDESRAFAVAHTLIKVIWAVLDSGRPYTDLGHDFYVSHRINPERQTRSLIAQLEALCGKKIILVDHDSPGPPGSASEQAAA